jgi:hypothetical protein
MVTRADFVSSQRRAAWDAGRDLALSLTDLYVKKYGLEVAPPPAKIVDELLTEFLGCELYRAPLGPKVFAQTEWIDGTALVTVNSDTAGIPGVKDALGVENVAKWHECIHVAEHGPVRNGTQAMLPGLEADLRIVCRRGEQYDRATGTVEREFRAEEAGRAAAVSLYHLRASPWFERLQGLAGSRHRAQAWQCLYALAEELGVNISALVTQLQHEDWIVVEGTGAGSVVHVQPHLSAPPVAAS